MKSKLTVAERLVVRSARDESGCLRWFGACMYSGYGQISEAGR